MGTYGITHVKKDNKIITMSDSYDGYLNGGMGQSNILCIKYLSTPILKKLFDKYKASKKISLEDIKNKTYKQDYPKNDSDDLDTVVSERELENVLFAVKKDTDSQEAVDWMKVALSDSVRTSICGFAPLLYLNINPHYGRDYEHYTYMIDLDEEVFITNNQMKISFEKIRKASVAQLNAFCEQVMEVITLDKKEEKLYEKFYDMDLKESQIEKVSNMIMDKYLSVDEKVLSEYYEKRKQEHLAWQAQCEAERLNTQEGEFSMEEQSFIGGFSIHSTNCDATVLRSVVTFIKGINKIPGCEFLAEHSEWGVNETYTEGGMRIFSPLTNDEKQNKLHGLFVQTLERKFKLKFNIFSSSGVWSNDEEDLNKEDSGESFFFFFSIPGPQKTLLTLDEIKALYPDDYEEIFEEGNPWLSLTGHHEDVRQLILNENNKVMAPILWLYEAILHQDKEMFTKVYPLAKELINSKELSNKKKTETFNKLLRYLADTKMIGEQILVFAEVAEQEVEVANVADFVKYLKTTDFFEYVEKQMSNKEKELYLNQ